MKWGRSKKHDRKNNEPAASPSPRCPLLSSWFSKFKKSDSRLLDPEQDEGGSLYVPRKIDDSPELPGYGGDEEFWRMSFGKDEEKFPPSVCRSCLSTIDEEEEEGAMKSNEMVSNVKWTRELERNFADIKMNVKESETKPNSRAPARMKTRSITKATEASRQSPSEHHRENTREDCQLQRKSPRSMRRRSRHIKVRSPRLNTAVNVRRSKKGRADGHREYVGSERDYESCAMVKCSYDPQRDFRKSMMEMIITRGIGGAAAEMEELLACYLILNDDTYHDVIIKVFRQVWFELYRRGCGGNEADVVGEDQSRAWSSGQD